MDGHMMKVALVNMEAATTPEHVIWETGMGSMKMGMAQQLSKRFPEKFATSPAVANLILVTITSDDMLVEVKKLWAKTKAWRDTDQLCGHLFSINHLNASAYNLGRQWGKSLLIPKLEELFKKQEAASNN